LFQEILLEFSELIVSPKIEPSRDWRKVLTLPDFLCIRGLPIK
jgi:hypothetical protein